MIAVVPVEPSEEQANAGAGRIVREFSESDWEDAKEMAEGLNQNQVYAAMLSARDKGPEDALFALVRAAEKLQHTFSRSSEEKALVALYRALDRARAYPALREVMEGE